jgi:hypothetical protein
VSCSDGSLCVLRVVAFAGDKRRITENDVLEIGPPGASECGELVATIKGHGEV